MKKLLPYILILIALVGIFSPATYINAQSTLGNCTDIAGTVIKQNVLQSDCIPPYTNKWVANTGTPPSVGGGTCSNPAHTTQETCLAPAETWTPNTGTTTNTTYNFLAPLPCDSSDSSKDGPGCVNGVLTSFNPTQANNLGAYLNLMIKIFIGICAVLAVVMIVMGGIQYMTSELPGNKEAGKERIKGAIFGLLLALGAYTLLNTINPDLLKTDLTSLADVTVTVTADESPASAVPAGSNETTTGMINASGIIVSSSIADGVNKLMAKANAEGIPLAGGGFRSVATQTQLRINNCHGDTTSAKPTPPCNPPTALPGNSMHNSGQAIDFTCSGALIQNETNQCFVWLSANAGIAGLTNFPKEQWHWSTNGR